MNFCIISSHNVHLLMNLTPVLARASKLLSAWSWVLVAYFDMGHDEVIVHHRN